MVTITGKAVSKIKELQSGEGLGEQVLRVYVAGGGCAGLKYGLAFDDAGAEDRTFEHEGVTVAIDPESAEYLDGSVLDYVDSLEGSGFVIENPNAASTCGCGKSFTTDDEAEAAGHAPGAHAHGTHAQGQGGCC